MSFRICDLTEDNEVEWLPPITSQCSIVSFKKDQINHTTIIRVCFVMKTSKSMTAVFESEKHRINVLLKMLNGQLLQNTRPQNTCAH